MALVFDGLLYLHVRHCKYVTTQKQTAFTIMHFKIETTNKKTERYNKIQNIYDVGRETEWMSENRIQNEYETMNCNNNYNINSMVRDSLMMLWCRKRYVQLYCCIAVLLQQPDPESRYRNNNNYCSTRQKARIINNNKS